MKKFLKWTLLVVAVLAVCALGAFLYFIPPFFNTPPEEFSKAAADAAPTVADITDPADPRDRRARTLPRRVDGLHRLPRDQRTAGSGSHQVPRRRRSQEHYA